MNDLVIDPITQAQINAYKSNPSHALIIVGPSGIGKRTIALQLSENMLNLSPGSFEKNGYGMIIGSDNGKAIGIELIRQLDHFLSLKVPRRGLPNRIIIIEDGHLLTIEAQNALLKRLEEPPVGTLFIITTSQVQNLLSTIRSRAPMIVVRRPDRTTVMSLFNNAQIDLKRQQQIYAISDGKPGLMVALILEDQHPLWNATDKARQLLNMSIYERLLAIESLVKNKELLADILYVMQQMARISLISNNSTKRWKSVLQASYRAAEALHSNAQPKLILTRLMLVL